MCRVASATLGSEFPLSLPFFFDATDAKSNMGASPQSFVFHQDRNPDNPVATHAQVDGSTVQSPFSMT
jgi:hypothetical protein